MFIECRACDGSGEGVYGHSWTTCPVCNGAGQVFVPVSQRVTYRNSSGSARQRLLNTEEINPTGVFPDRSYKDRELASA